MYIRNILNLSCRFINNMSKFPELGSCVISNKKQKKKDTETQNFRPVREMCLQTKVRGHCQLLNTASGAGRNSASLFFSDTFIRLYTCWHKGLMLCLVFWVKVSLPLAMATCNLNLFCQMGLCLPSRCSPKRKSDNQRKWLP